MTEKLGIGIVGCGNISKTYLDLCTGYAGIEIRACADIDPTSAETRAAEYGVRAETPENLLAARDIDIVVNLTIPSAHYAVSRSALEAGKHVYSEKPFALSMAEGKDLKACAAKNKLRIGSAPDTFLGGSHQLARYLIDTGTTGSIVSGTCHVLSRGMEHWHPNPDFFFKTGGGPILDLGPYYLANLVQLIGPVRRVAAMSSIPISERVITSNPRRGQKILVETPTTIHALLEFECGATVTLGTSWDVLAHEHGPFELYGTNGTLFIPDPNFFGGTVRLVNTDGPAEPTPWDHPLGIANQAGKDGGLANYRGIGLADMALSIMAGKPHRCSLEFALHVVEIMTAILSSGQSGKFVQLESRCERPEALSIEAAMALLARDNAK